MIRPLLASLALLPLVACSQGPAAAPSAVARRALGVADEYKSWGRVDDELRWAPFLCRQPMPGIPRTSASTDSSTHGQKLYSVFAKDHAGYPENSGVGQVIVKESWKAELVTDPSVDASVPLVYGTDNPDEDHFHPYATKDGQVFRASEPAGLFIMMRLELGPDTDEGWVYATVSPDKQVTGAGKIDSCMACHVEAPHGRLFGVPKSIVDR